MPPQFTQPPRKWEDSAWSRLPPELILHIARSLPKDRDLCSFMEMSQFVHDVISSPESGIWRYLFINIFDSIPNKFGSDLKDLYLERRRFMKLAFSEKASINPTYIFKNGKTRQEKDVLDFLRPLILESSFSKTYVYQKRLDEFSTGTVQRRTLWTSKNADLICRVIFKSRLFEAIFYRNSRPGTINVDLQTVQLLYFCHITDPTARKPTNSFCISQKAVYSHPLDTPIFKNLNEGRIHIENVLHMANFFVHHLADSGMSNLLWHFKHLAPKDRPRPWMKQLKHGLQVLGKCWKGTYAYLKTSDEVIRLRSSNPGLYYYEDEIDSLNDDGFQSLKLSFQSDTPDISGDITNQWPRQYERHLHALPSSDLVELLARDPSMQITKPPPKRKRQASPPTASPAPAPLVRGVDYLQFTGSGHDEDDFTCSGILHALPYHSGIPGWQRITFMKTRAVANGFELWAYEGVVLPGGMAMLGRWWAPDASDLWPEPADRWRSRLVTGPFVFWNVADGQD